LFVRNTFDNSLSLQVDANDQDFLLIGICQSAGEIARVPIANLSSPPIGKGFITQSNS